MLLHFGNVVLKPTLCCELVELLYRDAFVFALANKKTSYSFGATLCKGILANWLVNLAVWIANSAQVCKEYFCTPFAL
jgi:formate/nitrite transporter FocA (FNT family)